MTDELIELFAVLPQRIKTRRVARRMSQGQLAKACGVGVKVISSYETGARIGIIKIATLGAIAGALGTTVAELTRPVAIPKPAVNAFEAPMRLAPKRPRPVTIFRSSDFLQSSLNQNNWR